MPDSTITADPTAEPDHAPAIDDIEAWLDGISVPETTIHICGSAKLAARHEELVESLRAQRKLDDAVPEADRGMDHGARADEIAAQIDENAAAMKRASRVFRIRGLTTDENDDLLEKCTERDSRTRQHSVNGERLVAEQLSVAIMEPNLTPQQVEKLRARLSAGEFRRIMDTVRDLTQGITQLPL